MKTHNKLFLNVRSFIYIFVVATLVVTLAACGQRVPLKDPDSKVHGSQSF